MIQISDVTFSYEDAPSPALSHVSLEIRDGEMIAPEPHTRVEAGDELMVYRTGDVK